MSFDLMISLAAAEFQLIVAGSVVFIGFRAVLFLMAVHDDSTQFHLLTTNDGQINPYTLEYGNRMLTKDATQFKTMRCTKAQVNLGTERLPTSIKYSGGADKGKPIALDSHSATVQAGASAPLSAILGLQSTSKYVSHRLQFTPSSNYLKLLQDTAKEVAMVYDARQRRCWLVPKLSLLLHMSPTYASHCIGVPNGRVPLVAPHTNALDLVRSLESLGEIPILGDGRDAFLFRQLMLRLNTNLLRTVALVPEAGGRKLYGFEFMGIVTEPGRGSCMKELKVELAGKYWIDIAKVVDAIVFGGDLGDAITAAEGASTRSRQCNKVPHGFDYLTMTICCLKQLVE